MKLGTRMKRVKKIIKKVIKSGGHCACFWRDNADKYGYLGPFGKNPAQPKSRQEGEIFSMMHVVTLTQRI